MLVVREVASLRDRSLNVKMKWNFLVTPTLNNMHLLYAFHCNLPTKEKPHTYSAWPFDFLSKQELRKFNMIQGQSDLEMPFGQTRSHVYPDQAWIVSRRLQVCGCLLLHTTRATRVRQTQISNSKAPPRVNVNSKIVLASSAFGTPAPPQTYVGCKRWR